MKEKEEEGEKDALLENLRHSSGFYVALQRALRGKDQIPAMPMGKITAHKQTNEHELSFQYAKMESPWNGYGRLDAVYSGK